jgi:hypothetical protein
MLGAEATTSSPQQSDRVESTVVVDEGVTT